jgi:hypothetical protein
VAVSVLGIIANRIRVDVHKRWVYTKVVWSDRNSRKGGGFPRIVKEREIIGVADSRYESTFRLMLQKAFQDFW